MRLTILMVVRGVASCFVQPQRPFSALARATPAQKRGTPKKAKKMRVASFDVGVVNLAFVVADVDGDDVRVRAWRNVCVAPSAKAPKQELVVAVLRARSELDELLECGRVLVELQPRFSPLNVHVAHAIATFFLVRKSVDLDEPVEVHFVHAGVKNNYCAAYCAAAAGLPGLGLGSPKTSAPTATTPTAAPVASAIGSASKASKTRAKSAKTKHEKYAGNKKRAVETCGLLVGDGALAETWRAFKKKDDAADCMMQLLAWHKIPLQRARVGCA
jgi:hypothetical protein